MKTLERKNAPLLAPNKSGLICSVCGCDNGKQFDERGQRDILCYVCSCYFLVECQRRTGFGDTIVIVRAPDDAEPEFVLGRKKSTEPVN